MTSQAKRAGVHIPLATPDKGVPAKVPEGQHASNQSGMQLTVVLWVESGAGHTVRILNNVTTTVLLGLATFFVASGAPLHAAPAQSATKKHASTAKKTTTKPTAKTAHKATASTRGSKKVAGKGVKPVPGRHASRVALPPPTAQSRKLTSAFIASTQLRPMAQQLASTRSAAAYEGVLSYGRSHPGDGAATAYLALGHAYMLDHRYADAVNAYRQANTAGNALDDYADYLGAQAALQASHGADAYALLDHFADRHPDSIFVANAPVLLANAYIQQGNPQGALTVLQPLASSPQAAHGDFRYTLGRAYQLSGDTGHAATIYRSIYLTLPLSYEAGQSKTQLQAMGVQLTAAERKSHADQLFDAKHYAEASDDYHSIGKNDPSLSTADRNGLEIYVAVCDLKLKHLNRREVEALPETSDDSAALKFYLFSELDRNEGNLSGHDALIAQMVQRYPQSRWLEEALYSGGNMYLLKHDAANAINDYSQLVHLFPNSTYAPSAHWRAAWMSYRLRKYADAARLMDEQIQAFKGGTEIPSALYWRGRILEDEEHNFGQAVNYYKAVSDAYPNFYYAILARQRLAVLSSQTPAEPAVFLASVKPPEIPDLTGDLPENDVHLIRARLLANAALNEYIGPEILASPTSSQWGALAQAEIYASFGEYTRSLQSMKHSGLSFFGLPFDEVPVIYWRLLFPQPYWSDLVANSEKNGLDPYLVASLIRQESEFNAGVVSHANAYGLMQLLPSVGKAMAKKQGMKNFNQNQLLNPVTNLQLGTMNLKLVLDRFGGQKEYALAAYNAGDTPIRAWLATGDYKDIPEFVESIPYTETREYVQAILRNREMYRQLYPSK
ncbi:transglycosylase SLT domain-containing protein [Granulicella arctica]|uniref:transglycosylase SLT domain-containing protein n=1 Tax=Granulicella arctica TaxID=940613 RepID=UPI0021E0038B|nr:transglycosylase SLT domain-containing protein [Granulicella arctica]